MPIRPSVARHETGLCCYLVIRIENLLRPLQLFYFQLWSIYWLSLVPYIYTDILCIHVVRFYDFHTFNTFVEKLSTIRPKWVHFDYIFINISQYIYVYMYASVDGQLQLKYVAFSIINLMIYWYIQFNTSVYTTINVLRDGMETCKSMYTTGCIT
jgi:hypothetical protein